MSERVAFSSLFEALGQVICERKPELVNELARLGVDLTALSKDYPITVWRDATSNVAQRLFPELSPPVAEYRLGQLVMRRFEKTLLKELGYGLTLDVDVETGHPVVPEGRYAFLIERGPVARAGVGADGTATGEDTPALTGKTLLDMAADDYSDPRTRLESRRLMRQLISHHLGGKSLQSRRVFMELQEL